MQPHSSISASKKRSSIPTFSFDNLPAVLVLIALTIAVCAYGADTQLMSLTVSLLICFSLLCSVMFVREFKFSKFTIFLLLAWSLFSAVSYILGRVEGAEDEYLMLLTAIAVFQVGVYSGEDRHRFSSAWKLMLYIGGAFSAFSFFQHFLMPNTIFGVAKPYHFSRLTGTFLSSNSAATFLGVILILAFAQFHRDWRRYGVNEFEKKLVRFFTVFPKSFVSIFVILFSTVCLLLTASRAGIASTALAVFVFWGWTFLQGFKNHRGSGRSRLVGPTLIGLCLVAVMLFFWNLSGELAQARYEDLFVQLSDRAYMRQASFTAAQYKPWFGHGLGSLNEAKLLGVTPESNMSVMLQNASHNVVAQWLVQGGWVGLGFLSFVLLIITRRVIVGMMHAKRLRTYNSAVFCISLLVITHGMFDYALEVPAIMLFFSLIMGLGFGNAKLMN